MKTPKTPSISYGCSSTVPLVLPLVSILRRTSAAWLFALSCLVAKAAPLPDDIQLVVTAEGQTQTLNLHKRSTRSDNFTPMTWDAVNGYQVLNPAPEVRTFRGTVSENPNALVLASIDTTNRLRVYCFDMEHSHNVRWSVITDVGAQLVSPATPLPMPSQTLAAPRDGSAGIPKIGKKLPTGSSAPVGTPAVAVPYGELVEYELAADLVYGTYVDTGRSVENTLTNFELTSMLYEQTMARDAVIRTQISTVVIRKDSFYGTDPGEVGLGSLGANWNKAPLASTSWDCVWGSMGHYSNSALGHGNGFGAGALYHENAHNWNASHLSYQCDAMGGTKPSLGPITVEKIITTRKAAIDHGWLPQGEHYPDPMHPHVHVDITRSVMNTAIDIDVLANDYDINGDVLHVSSFTTTTKAGGTVTLNPNGTLHYVPAANYIGKDMIVYVAQDDSTMALKSKDIVHIEVVNNGLQARYGFDETSGTISTESTGQGPVANLNGTDFSTDSVLSPLGRGVRASGWQGDGHVENGSWSGIILGATKAMPDDQPLHPSAGNWMTPFEDKYNQNGGFYDVMDGNYTFSTWFRCDDYKVGCYIASKWWHNEPRFGWDLMVNKGKLRMDWRVFDGAQGNRYLEAPVHDFIPGKWYQAACVFDRATSEVRLYLNGAQVASYANAFPSNGVIFQGRAPLALGCFSKRAYCFDDARIYSKALNGTDMQALYNEPGTAPRFLIPSLEIAAHTEISMAKTLWPSVWTGGDDNLSFSMMSGPAWLSVSAGGVLGGTPGSTDVGVANAVVRITDSSGAHADLPVTLTISSSQFRARWRFNEGSGAVASDSSGNGNTASLQGATWNLPAREGSGSLAFESASSQYAQAPSLDTAGGFTLAAWIRPSIFVGKHTIISQQGSYAFKVNGSTLALEIPGVADHNTASGLLASRGDSKGVFYWQHVAVTFQPGVADGVKFYVDGVLKSTMDASALNQSTFPTLIGKTADWTNQNYSGEMDDVRVYASILSGEEILSTYRTYPTYNFPEFASASMTRVAAVEVMAYSATLAGSATDEDAGETLSYSKVSGPAWLNIAANGTLSGTPALADIGLNTFTVSVADITGQTDTATLKINVNRYLAAHWKFDEGTGTIAADSSGSGNDAERHGAPWSWSRVGSYALDFNGTMLQYAIADSVDTSAGFTLAGWIKPDVLTGGRSIITQQNCYAFRTKGTGLTLSAPGNADHDTPTGLLATGQWQHVAVSFSPSTANGAKFYVNGVLVATLDASAITQNSNDTVLGRTANTSGVEFDGGLDDLRIYSQPLDGVAISGLYNSYPVPNAPSFINDPITGTSWGGYGAYSGTLAGTATDPDVGPESFITYSKVSGPSWISIAPNGAISGIVPSAPGMNTFVVKVTDNTGLSDTATLNIMDISNVRPAFTANPITGSGATEDSAYSGSIASYGTDANGGTLTYAKVSGPAWLDVASNGALSGTPDNSHVGVNAFTVKVIDSWGAFVTGTLNITVANTNDAPGFAGNPIIKAETVCMVPYSGSIAADASDPDGAGEILTFTKVSGPAWLSVASDGTLSGSPTDTDGGLNSFTVRVTDGASAYGTANLQIMVTGIAWSNTAGGSWTTTGNWNGGVVASGANKIANFATLDLTVDTVVTLNGARTLGHLAFGDITPSHNWTLSTGTGGPLTLDVASGSPLITVNNQTATIGAVIAGNDGLTKAGAGTLVLNAANTYSGGTILSAGTLAIGHASAAGSGSVTLGNNTTFRANYISASPTLANTFSIPSGNSALIDLIGSGVANNTLTLGSGAIALNGTLRVTRSAGGTGTTNFTGALTGSGVLEVGNTQAGVAPVSVSGSQGRCVFTSASAYNAFTGDIRVLNGGNLGLFNGNLNGQDVTIETGGYITLCGGFTTIINQLDGGGAITKNAGGTATLNVSRGDFSGIISKSALLSTGTLQVVKAGPEALTLSGINSYLGATTVSGGTLNITGSLGETPVTVQSGGTLSGTGSLAGAVTVQTGGGLTPGGDDFGNLTIVNAVTLAGTTTMQIGHVGAVLPTDKLGSVTTVTYGGYLVVVDAGTDPLAAGDSFCLFDANVYSGSFSSVTLPVLSAGLMWDTVGLAEDGTISVNTIPVAVDDDVIVQEDGPELLAVLANDSDADSDPLTILSVTQGNHGLVEIVDNMVSYTPVANWHGTDGFTYSITDQRGGSFTASVTVTVAAVNDAPTLGALSDANATEDVAFIGSVAGAASDIDVGQTLIFSKASGPAWLNVAANGVLSGTPLNNDVGTNHFVIRVTDGGGAYAESALVIHVTGVNDAPTFTANPFIKPAAISLMPYSGSIAASASDVDAGDTFTFSKVSGPAWLNVASKGDLSGMPADTDAGLNSFSIKVMDVAGASTTATLEITVTSITWINVAGGSWPVTGNWNAGIVANAPGITGNFATLNLTTNAVVTLDGARTVGHLVFGDTTPTHNWTVNTGSGGPLTLDVPTGSPWVTVNNQTTTLGAVVAGNDGLAKAGAGTLALTAANTYSGGTTIADGILAIGNTGALGSGEAAIGNATLRVNYLSATPTLSNTLSVASGSSATLDLIGSGSTGNTLTLGTGTITANGTLRVTRSAGNTGATNFSALLAGAGILEIGNTQAGVAPAPSSLSQGRCTFTSSTAYAGFSGSIRVLNGGNLCLFNGTLNGQNVTIDSGGYLSLLGGVTTVIGDLSGSGALTKNAGGNATLQVGNGNFSGVIAQNLLLGTGTTALTKSGGGVLTLGGASTYTGVTTVSGGTLNITGSLGVTNTTVQTGATLGGTGTLGGTVTVQSGGTLAPGVSGTGTLTLGSKALVLSGTAAMEIGRSGGTLSNDKIAGITTLTYGGTLLVSKTGTDPLQTGDAFQLFSATTYSGTFATLTLPTLGVGLTWNTSRIAVDGYIFVQGSVPAGWAVADIGSTGVPGGSNYASGTFTVSGSGAAVGGTADAFQSVSQTLTGDGEIRARITSQTNTNALALAGLMLRDGSAANSVNAFIGLMPANGFIFQARSTSGATTTQIGTAASNTAPNNWLRLTRSGTQVAGYVSADGSTWTQVGATALTMASNVSASLAVTSHDNAVTGTAVFDNVSITPYPSPWLTGDIGSVGIAGRSEFYNNTHTLNGAGVIAGTSDGLRFTYQTLSSDGAIIARIPVFANTGTGSRIGVMIRDTLAANSSHIFIGTDGSGAFTWTRRTAAGGTTATSNTGTAIAPNVWVRLVRTGSDVAASTSTDGAAWVSAGTVTVAMASNCYIGLATGSGNTSGLNRSNFDNVTVTP